MSLKSRRDKWDLAEISSRTRRDLWCLWDRHEMKAISGEILTRSRRDSRAMKDDLGEICNFSINYISILSASHYPVTVKTTTKFSNICYLLLKSFLIRFLYIFVLWEVSTGDAVMTRLFFQSLCHALSFMWLPLWYNSKLAKNIPLFFNNYSYSQICIIYF